MRTCIMALLTSLTFGVSCIALLANQAAQQKMSDDEKIIGTWKLTVWQGGGMDLSGKLVEFMRLTFSNDGKWGFGQPPDLVPTVARYKLAGPGQIDVGGDNANGLGSGIYKFDGDDRLTLCFSDTNKRPTEFSSSEKMLWVLQRVKPDEKMTEWEKANLDAALKKIRDAENRSMNAQNLQRLATAFHEFHDIYKTLPAHAIYSKDGKTPLLSWRVTLLPHLEQVDLYQQFKLEEPWDSQHNKKLISKMPEVYAHPGAGKQKDGLTNYQVFCGPLTLFDGAKKMTWGQVTLGDGLSNTLLVIEASNPVIWTKPADLDWPKDSKEMPALGGLIKDGIHVAICDGAVIVIRRDLEPAILRALITPNGGEKIDWEKIEK